MPRHLFWFIQTLIAIIVFSFVAFGIGYALGLLYPREMPESSLESNSELSMAITVQGNSFISPTIPHYPKIRVLGSLMSKPLTKDEVEIAFPIVDSCEAKGNPNAKNPKSSAYGICQFIDGTWSYVQVKWNMVLDRNNPEHQIYACKRLMEEEGLTHWEDSRSCWEPKLKVAYNTLINN